MIETQGVEIIVSIATNSFHDLISEEVKEVSDCKSNVWVIIN